MALLGGLLLDLPVTQLPYQIETCVSMKGIMYLHRYMMKTQ